MNTLKLLYSNQSLFVGCFHSQNYDHVSIVCDEFANDNLLHCKINSASFFSLHNYLICTEHHQTNVHEYWTVWTKIVTPLDKLEYRHFHN